MKDWGSENWGAAACFLGDVILIAAGDASGFLSMCSFLVAELSFLTIDQKNLKNETWKFSLGCAGLSFGDGLLCFSQATEGNPTLKLTMALLTGLWLLGACRLAFEKTGKLLTAHSMEEGNKLQKIADGIPTLVGSAALLLRLPALSTAAFAGEHINIVMLACNFFWGAADILLGRVQRFIKTSAAFCVNFYRR